YTNYAHAGYAATTVGNTGDGWALTAGGSYTIDAWSFGLQGIYASYAQSATAILGTSAPGVSASREQMWGVSLNGAYALGPGISPEGQVAYAEANYGSRSTLGLSVPVPLPTANGPGVNASKVHSIEFDLGTAINF